jgi:5'-nucleotidase
MKILITNDDGIDSPTLPPMVETLSREHEVFVVVPGSNQSGLSQAFTFYKSLTYHPRPEFNHHTYQVDGTPCDCVKFAVCQLFKDSLPDCIISGINVGENAGLCVIYSGTVAAAREGTMWGIPSLAISIWKNDPSHINYSVNWLNEFLKRKEQWIHHPLLNINFPSCRPDEIQGTEISSMSLTMFRDDYKEFTTPRGTQEYWLGGYKPKEEFQPDTDDADLLSKKITITPLTLDQTDHSAIDKLKESLSNISS